MTTFSGKIYTVGRKIPAISIPGPWPTAFYGSLPFYHTYVAFMAATRGAHLIDCIVVKLTGQGVNVAPAARLNLILLPRNGDSCLHANTRLTKTLPALPRLGASCEPLSARLTRLNFSLRASVLCQGRSARTRHRLIFSLYRFFGEEENLEFVVSSPWWGQLVGYCGSGY